MNSLSREVNPLRAEMRNWQEIKIIVAGGTQKSTTAEACHQRWTFLPEMNEPRLGASLVVWEEKKEDQENPSNNIQRDLLATKTFCAAMLSGIACTFAVSVIKCVQMARSFQTAQI